MILARSDASLDNIGKNFPPSGGYSKVLAFRSHEVVCVLTRMIEILRMTTLLPIMLCITQNFSKVICTDRRPAKGAEWPRLRLAA